MSNCNNCDRELGDRASCGWCGAPAQPADADGAADDHQHFLPPPRVGLDETVIRQAPPVPTPAAEAPRTDKAATSGSVTGRRGPLIVVLVSVLTILLAGLGTAVAVIALRDDDTPGGNKAPATELDAPTGQKQSPTSNAPLPTSFVRPPTSQWEVQPSDFLGGEPGVFLDARPYGYSELSGAEALYTPDAVVVGVIGMADGATPRILGLDPASGQLRWQFAPRDPDGYGATCFSLPSKHAVACLADQQMTVVDTSRDEVSRPVVNQALAVLNGTGNSIYSITYASSEADTDSGSPALASVTVLQGTLSNPGAGWQQTYPVRSGRGYDGGLAGAVADGRLALDLEGIQLLVDESSGKLLEQGSAPQQSTARPFGLDDAAWQDIDPEPGSVVSGSTRITLDDDLTEVTASSVTDQAVNWTHELPDPSVLEDEYGEGFGRSSIGIAGSSVVFSSMLVLEGWTGFGTGTSDDLSSEVRYRTPCGREPEVTAKSATDGDGTVKVILRFVATCPGGQWIDGSAVRLNLARPSGEAFGRGVYDFSKAPVWLLDPDDDPDTTGAGTEVSVSLPPGSVFALPVEIEAGITTIVVECEHTAGSSGSDDAPADDQASAALYTPYAPAGDQRDNTDALATLKRIAAADKPSVDQTLEGQWVAQLSSKQNGTTDPLENHTYDYSDILAEHLRLRLTHPNVRLLFSSNWKSFTVPRFWVTAVATPSPTPRTPNAFCDREGFADSHCYAKRILRDGPSKGSTMKRSD